MYILMGLVFGIAFIVLIKILVMFWSFVFEYFRLRREAKERQEIAIRKMDAEAAKLARKAAELAMYTFPPETVDANSYRVYVEKWSNYIPAKRLPDEYLGHACPRCSTEENVVLMFPGETGNDTSFEEVYTTKRGCREEVCACGLHLEITEDYSSFSYNCARIFELKLGVDTTPQLTYTGDTESVND